MDKRYPVKITEIMFDGFTTLFEFKFKPDEKGRISRGVTSDPTRFEMIKVDKKF